MLGWTQVIKPKTFPFQFYHLMRIFFVHFLVLLHFLSFVCFRNGDLDSLLRYDTIYNIQAVQNIKKVNGHKNIPCVFGACVCGRPPTCHYFLFGPPSSFSNQNLLRHLVIGPEEEEETTER